jgi:predicted outer membrane protein
MKTMHILVAAAAAAFALSPAVAQRAPMFAASQLDAVKRLSPEQRQERQFLREAAAHLRLQTQASKLALARSTNAPVRNIAAALLNHGNATHPEMLHLLQSRGMAMPMLGSDEVRLLKQLNKASGAKFDRIYLQEVALRSSEADAVLYERILGVTHDAQLQAWVERHLATVRYHATLAGKALPGEASRYARGRRESRLADTPPTNVMGANPAIVTRPAAPLPRPPVPSV